MTKIKPTLSKGTRDFLPQEVAKRNYIFDTIKGVFRKYGFEQIETPAIERLETLTGKYGEEGDKLLFKILNSGDYLKDIPADVLTTGNSQLATKSISEKGLRYDLTVPLARYVVQHQEEITFPFKRFHIGPVWRADRPQKGRYQEFYQCDADVIGSTSLLNEVELTMIYAEVFKELKLQVSIKVNNRKLIDEVFEKVGISGDKKREAIVVIDKLDKIGQTGVSDQLIQLSLSTEQVDQLWGYLQNMPYYDLEGFSASNELNAVMSHFNSSTDVFFDGSLMRGLDYYTGTVWEVTAKAGSITSSLGGGGRYDNLTEMFGGQNMSGVGISFGIERIYDVMEELNLFPPTILEGAKVLFVPRDKAAEDFAFSLTQKAREKGVSAEIFLGNVKKQKQFNYAEQKSILYIVEIGGDEVSSGKFRLRNVKEKREEARGLTQDDLIQKLAEI